MPARFFDNRAAYLMFSTATTEKPVVADRIGDELAMVEPGHRSLRVFDAGMGDASVLTRLSASFNARAAYGSTTRPM